MARLNWMRDGWQRVRSLIRWNALERGLDEEIRFHIDQQAEKNLRAGMTPGEARRRAFVQFGGESTYPSEVMRSPPVFA